MNKKRFLGLALVMSLLAATLTPIGIAAGIIANPAKSAVYVNGQKVDLQAYTIGNNTYFKLRDIGEKANFAVKWDSKSNAIQINTSEAYAADAKGNAAQKARVLQQNNWAPNTYNALNNLIKNNGILSAKYDAKNKPYVVFDFDNTTAINDVQEALLIYQLENLRFKVKPDMMKAVLETGIPDVSKKFSDSYKGLTVETVATDCASDYDYLYKNYVGFGAGGKVSLADIQKTNEYKDFTTKVRFLYDAVNDTFDSSVGYPWVTYLFTGMTPDEVYKLADESHTYWTNYGKFTKVTWESPKELPGKAGVVSVSYKTGITFTNELKDLYNTLMENGIDVYVCSASFIDVIKAAACDSKFGLNVKESNVYAMMLKKDASGKYINEYDYNYFQTQGKGKTHTINAFIRGQYGNRGPIMVAGDSSGDYNMMVDYADMQLGLLFNRYRKDATKELALMAEKTMGQSSAKYVLQGRDENAGQLRASEKSILLGTTEEVLVRH